MIRIFVGTDGHMERSDRVLEYSIRKNTEAEVEFTWMRAGGDDPTWNGWVGQPSLPYGRKPRAEWATCFTMFRFAIPELCDYQGYAIYLDTDMLVLGDIEELWDMRQPGKWRMCGSDDVSVIDCSAFRHLKLERLKQSGIMKHEMSTQLDRDNSIPWQWDCRDEFPTGAKLIHFTQMRTQPWHPWPERFDYKQEHRDPRACMEWRKWEEAALAAETA